MSHRVSLLPPYFHICSSHDTSLVDSCQSPLLLINPSTLGDKTSRNHSSWLNQHLFNRCMADLNDVNWYYMIYIHVDKHYQTSWHPRWLNPCQSTQILVLGSNNLVIKPRTLVMQPCETGQTHIISLGISFLRPLHGFMHLLQQCNQIKINKSINKEAPQLL